MFNKKNISFYISLILVVAVALLFWRLPFLSTLDGFLVMSMWQVGTWGVFVALFQTLSFLTLVGLIIVPVLAMMSQRGILRLQVSEKTMTLINFINICVFAGLNFFNLIWMIVLAATYNVAFGVGALFTTILAVGTMVLLIIMQYANEPKSPKASKSKRNNDEIVVEVNDTETK